MKIITYKVKTRVILQLVWSIEGRSAGGTAHIVLKILTQHGLQLTVSVSASVLLIKVDGPF